MVGSSEVQGHIPFEFAQGIQPQLAPGDLLVLGPGRELRGEAYRVSPPAGDLHPEARGFQVGRGILKEGHGPRGFEIQGLRVGGFQGGAQRGEDPGARRSSSRRNSSGRASLRARALFRALAQAHTLPAST